ncbi:hypothetical protein MIMGU_mgv1a025082mg [Erythranthe guttata]|uniref:CTLH domain-containing protein n=1 Tax=Erythranthe guttata TaxID=4155 RepID=A0A022RV83_ERYGU|nr:hypothetical protein MIMGU_mgv1a025082mg [Erythranthe guttata]
MGLPSASSYQEGGGDASVFFSKRVVKKTKLVRDITKLLYSLDKGPGIELHKERVDLFMEQIIDGKWDESRSTLRDIDKYVDKITFVILKNKFHEHLSRDDKAVDAYLMLKHEIASLDNGNKITRKLLPALIVSPSPSQHNFCGQDQSGLTISSRKRVLEDLRNLFPPRKKYFGYPQHGKGAPYRIKQLLKGDGAGEVWFVQFSHSGKYLAGTGGADVIVWPIFEDLWFGPMTTKLVGHTKPVSYITWRHDDVELLSCGVGETVKRWNIPPTGGDDHHLISSCLHTYEGKENLGTVSCAWGPHGETIFAGLNDGSIVMWSLQGEELRSWDGILGITRIIADLAVTLDDGGREVVVTACERNTILLFKWGTESKRFIYEDGDIVSFTLSGDGNFLLVSLSNEEIHLWNIGACFFGRYIASGSEDSWVYVWHRCSGELLGTVHGHSDTVNSVTWNPAHPLLVASGSDDHTVRIWR